MNRAICTRWPDLDPLEVARWPWHRTAFYVEWLGDISAQLDAEADEEQRLELERHIRSTHSGAA